MTFDFNVTADEQPSKAVSFFLELAAIPSPPGRGARGRRPGRRVSSASSASTVDEDDTGPAIGSTIGNLYCAPAEHERRRHADLPLRAPRHGAAAGRDRAGRRGRRRPQREPARSSAPTTRRPSRRWSRPRGAVVEEGAPHAGIELLFTPKEEVGLRGAYAFDHTRLHAGSATSTTRRRRSARSSSARRRAASSSSRSTAAPRTPGCIPEEGRSAIAAAARAIADFRLGRIDEETTANVGHDRGRHARATSSPSGARSRAEAR